MRNAILNYLHKLFGSRQCLHCGSWRTNILCWGSTYDPALKQAVDNSEQRICNVCDGRMYISIKKIDEETGDVID